MKRLICMLLIVWCAVPGLSLAQGDEPPMYRIVAYYTSWSVYDRAYFVTDIPADQITHINYAFANISDEGECVQGDAWADTGLSYPNDETDAELLGNFRQLNLLKEKYPHLKTLISVGGWTWSGKFSDVALTAEARTKFVASCVAFMQQYGFDGIDLDWEYPVGGGLTAGRPEDKENFTLLLAELRAQLDAAGEGYLLTIAASASPTVYNEQMELDKIIEYLDWINVMAYDFYGGWSETTGFQSALYSDTDNPSADAATVSADAALQGYLAAGVPADKLVMGVPFYGRGWSNVGDTANGLYQPFNGLPNGTWAQGAFDYSDIEQNYLPTFNRYWHEQAQVPWLYNPDRKIMIVYEDPESLAVKTNYIKENGLGGIMFWELSADNDAAALLNAVYTGLQAP